MMLMENNMKIIEDRMENKMEKFEMLMKNASTTGSGYVTSALRTIQPPTNDSQTPWSSYKKQFEAAATANLWEEEQKGTALVIALRGAALEILQTLSEEDRNRYSALTAALGLRFGDKHVKKFLPPKSKQEYRKWRNLCKNLKQMSRNWYVLHIPTHHHPSKRGLRQKIL
ncbi:hypothetical protein DD592_26870 [Enterobacter cloacae complex sp. 2DZ2F20B]|nr:hypothetical protein DD592_26870 [Enterobacter cloacae complex sp. 2DZ2F20B]